MLGAALANCVRQHSTHSLFRLQSALDAEHRRALEAGERAFRQIAVGDEAVQDASLHRFREQVSQPQSVAGLTAWQSTCIMLLHNERNSPVSNVTQSCGT